MSLLVLLDLATVMMVRFSSPPGAARWSRQWALLPLGAGILVVVLMLGAFIGRAGDPILVIAATVLAAHRFALVALLLRALRATGGAPTGAPTGRVDPGQGSREKAGVECPGTGRR